MHDPEKWAPVFGKDHAQQSRAGARRAEQQGDEMPNSNAEPKPVLPFLQPFYDAVIPRT
jgi:hypothetical protein